MAIETPPGSADGCCPPLFEFVNDAVFLRPLGPDGTDLKFIYANDRACELTGYSREELLNKFPADLSPDVTPSLLSAPAQLLTKGRAIFDSSLRAKNGAEVAVEISARVFEWQGRRMVVSIARDRRERHRLEEAVRHAQKMEAVGQLAGGIAHDINNSLSAILMQLGALRHGALTTEAAASLKDLEEEAMRGSNLTRQLLLFSRRQNARPAPLELIGLVNNLLKVLRRLLGERVEVSFKNSAGAVWINGDAGMMEEVVTNLCINARDAMPEGGKLTLKAALVEVRPEKAISHPGARAGNYICLSVTDTGCGIEAGLLGKIFEPFFTTKNGAKGTGMGLSTVYGIVEQHHGWIEVQSAPGKGASFRVFLPAIAQPIESPFLAAIGHKPSAGGETILLVEDEQALRIPTALCLRKLGYAVLEAGDGVEAIEVWKQHHRAISLLFTDMVMPGRLTGLDLAERFRKEKRSLKVLISSGYSASLETSNPADLRDVTFLAKPYRAVTVAKVVRQCLDETGRRGEPNLAIQP